MFRIYRSYLPYAKLFSIAALLLLTGCGATVRTSITDKSLNPLTPNAEVIILDKDQAIPDSCKVVGTIKIGDDGFSTDCGYDKVMEIAKDRARIAGGNIVKITELLLPGASTCYRLKATILYKAQINKKLAHTNLPLQNKKDSIYIPKKGDQTYHQNGTELTLKQIWGVTSINPNAVKDVRAAKTNNVFAYIFAYAGGFNIGYAIGYSLAGGGKLNWTQIGIGAGIVCISIPFSIAANKHTKKAIELYNGGLK